MALSLPAADNERLNRALGGWRDWRVNLPARPVAQQRLNGASNTAVLVESGGRQFVIRLDGDSRHLGVDRDVERTVLEDIRGRWFAPTLVWTGPDFIVMNYVQGAREQLTPVMLAELLQAIHATPTHLTEEFDLVAHIRRYQAQLEPLGARLAHLIESVLSAPMDRAAPRLCHMDLIPDNIIVSGDRAIVIDWEYARLFQPAFDIATVIEGHALTPADAAALIGACGVDPFAVRQMQRLYRLAEGLWWEIKGLPSPEVWERLETLLE